MRFQVIEGGGRPEQDDAWLATDIGPEATALRVERDRKIREEREARLAARPQCIYKMYDADGVLLYVGISVNGPERMKGHRATKDWWQRVARIELEHHGPGRKEIEARELELIRSLNPLWNVAGKEAS